MKLDLLTLAVLALATYRLARLVVEDTITDAPRKFVQAKATTKLKNAQSEWLEINKDAKWVWRKLYALTSCHWCVSVWASGANIALAHYQGSWFKYVAYALAASTLAGWGTRIG